jgi:hypothetical protein
MTEELDRVEMLNALSDLAELARRFFLELREQGFLPSEALALTQTWMRTTLGGGGSE